MPWFLPVRTKPGLTQHAGEQPRAGVHPRLGRRVGRRHRQPPAGGQAAVLEVRQEGAGDLVELLIRQVVDVAQHLYHPLV